MLRVALLLVAALLVAGCGSTKHAARNVTPLAAAQQKTGRFAGAAVRPPITAPPIALHDAYGNAVSLAGQRGRFVLVTFLYTHCPDVCPLIAANLNAALRALGSRARDVRVIAVSVDPKGDTPAAVRAYIRSKHLVPQFRYLIGTRTQLRRVWAPYHVLAVAEKADLVDHVAYTVLVDRTGKERVLYDSHVRQSQVVHDLKVLMQTHSSA